MASCRTPMSLIGETATYASGSHSVTWRLVFIVQLKTSFLLGGGSRHSSCIYGCGGAYWNGVPRRRASHSCRRFVGGEIRGLSPPTSME